VKGGGKPIKTALRKDDASELDQKKHRRTAGLRSMHLKTSVNIIKRIYERNAREKYVSEGPFQVKV